MNSDLEGQIHTFHWVTNNFYLCLYEVQEALETVIAVSKSAGFFSLTITYFHFLSRCNYFNSFWDRGIIMSSWSVLKGAWDTLKLVRWQQKKDSIDYNLLRANEIWFIPFLSKTLEAEILTQGERHSPCFLTAGDIQGRLWKQHLNYFYFQTEPHVLNLAPTLTTKAVWQVFGFCWQHWMAWGNHSSKRWALAAIFKVSLLGRAQRPASGYLFTTSLWGRHFFHFCLLKVRTFMLRSFSSVPIFMHPFRQIFFY